MIEIRSKLLASALALAVGGFIAASCVDNSGNKTYPRDAGAADEGLETATDAPAGDAPAPSDTATGDTGTNDAGVSDTGGDRAADTAAAGDAGDASGTDLRVDLGTGG
jgi:hypothetical protein